nr:hypothetical protein [Halostagnicola sp. A56]
MVLVQAGLFLRRSWKMEKRWGYPMSSSKPD